MAAQRTLDPLILVRVRAPQLTDEMSEDDPHLSCRILCIELRALGCLPESARNFNFKMSNLP